MRAQLYRHGDRTPAFPYPTDPYADLSFWPVPWGALTKRGRQQHFELGQWLRQRYGNVLLSEQYSPDEINVRSTDVERTLESAEANLAGLYPPSGYQKWNDNLAWQPIPVHTVEAERDWLIGGSVPTPCPVYDNALSSLDTTREFFNLYKNSKPLMDYLKLHSGMPIDATLRGLSYVLLIRDTLFIQSVNNMT